MYRLFNYLLFCFLASSGFAQQLATISENYSRLPPVPNVTQDCHALFRAIYNQDNSNDTIVKTKKFMVEESGHNVNDLGSYVQCLKNSNYTYKVLKINIQPEGFGYLGICSPKYCSTDDWNKEIHYFQDLIPAIGGVNFSNITFTVVDPSTFHESFDAGSYIVAILMSAMIFSVIGVTVYNSYFDTKPKEQGTPFIRVADSHLNASATSPFAGINRISSEASSFDGRGSFEREEPRKSLKEKILFSFDLGRNLHELTNQDDRADQDRNLQIWNGIKAFSISYVAFGHVFLLGSTDKNVPAAIVFAQESWWFLIVFGATYAVDMFFFISGFLAAYVLVEKLKAVPFGLVNLIRVYLYRLTRLWPTYVFVILLFWKIAPFFASGPVWFLFNNFTKACSDTWWKNFLLIDNIAPAPLNDHCVIWGFYVAAEFQSFLVTPFVVWLYIKHKDYGKTTLWVLILISIAAAYSFSIQSNLPYEVQVNPPPNVQDIFNEFFTNPLVHWSTYFMGVYGGILYRNYKNGEKNIYYDIQENRRAGYILAISGLFIILISIFAPRTEQTYWYIWPESLAYLWAAAGRPFIILGVWFLVLPTLSGHAISMRNFLSWTLFNIMSTIVYPLYLIHFIVVLYIYTSGTQFTAFQLGNKIALTVTVLATSIFIASLIHLFIEKPIIGITRGLLPARKFRVSAKFPDVGSGASV